MDQTKKALEALQEKRQNQGTINQNRTKNLTEANSQKLRIENSILKNKIKELEKFNEFLTKLASKYDELLNSLFEEKIDENDKIIYDIFKCYVESKHEHSQEIIDMCMEISNFSVNAYNALKKYLPILPDIEYLENLKKDSEQNFFECLLDVKKIPEMIVNYKRENSIISTSKLYCCLAVDALYFKPDIKVGPNGVQGFLEDIHVGQKEFSLYSHDIDFFISFVRENWSKVIRSGFVFQINPLFVQFKPFVIHIIQSSHGKASKSIIDMLYEIKNILHNHRIEIVAFSFDGDNAYSNMNQLFYDSFINRMLKKNLYQLDEPFQLEFLLIFCTLSNAYDIDYFHALFIWVLTLILKL